jgi:hypothetical protein
LICHDEDRLIQKGNSIMARHIFFRDFTPLKAAALTVLIAVAAMAGETQTMPMDGMDSTTEGARLIPAVFEALIN